MLEKIIQGGPMMIPLMTCSVLAVAVVLDRAFAFRANSRVDTRALRAEILTLLAEARLQDAELLCASTPGPVAAVLLVGLQTYGKLKQVNERPEAIRMVMSKAMEDYHAHAMSAVEKRFNVLSAIGNSAPLFGMAGTVTGMIAAFGAMVEAAGLDARLVAGGIKEALITTAAGLLIALGAVIPYNIFSSMGDEIGLEIEEATAELVDYIARHETRG
jgi:biopolymer transport protein ExbB